MCQMASLSKYPNINIGLILWNIQCLTICMAPNKSLRRLLLLQEAASQFTHIRHLGR